MKIVVACDSYKGCMSSIEVNRVIEQAIKDVDDHYEVKSFALGDGGEGTTEAFVEACGGEYVHLKVRDAYFREIDVSYGLIEQGATAVIEVASCIALNMVERERRKPMYATSFGVGEMLLDASKRKVKKIIIGLGGSSTNDGGMGLLQALGAKFYDENNHYLKSNAMQLQNIKRIDLQRFHFLNNIEIVVACDVKNTLLGENGATYVFGKQKGLYPNQIRKLDKAMKQYANIFLKLGYDIASHEGSGAAGGIGGALTLLNATFMSGLDLLRTYNHMDDVIKDVDLVITGEGQSDKQTLYGKVPVGIANIASTFHKPCICISGALGVEYNKLYDFGFIGIYSVADRAMTFEQALQNAPDKLYACTYTIMKTIHYFVEDYK